MKILWLCNIILPKIAHSLNLKASNKEGWLSGIAATVEKSHEFDLAVCFPVPKQYDGYKETIDGIKYYGFYEDTVHPDIYDESLEVSLKNIKEDFKPDVIHIFGTEYPHTLAMCRVNKDTPKKLLIGLQGVMDIYKDHYFDGLPEYVIKRATFRDILKKDSLIKQQKKFAIRALNEVKALKIAGNITGRTPFDLEFSVNTNPDSKYHFLNETLRPEFYEGAWDIDTCKAHSIFLSQGNYPIKGLHTMLEALNKILKKFQDTEVRIAGDIITGQETLKDKIKISSYGKYILELIKKYDLKEHVTFVGNLDAEGIKKELLNANLFVCPSSIENSPNSLGEAMILGVPCIASNVGGISGIFKSDIDGLMFENTDSEGLYDAVIRFFKDQSLLLDASEHASMHAHITHNPDANYKRLLEIYGAIYEKD